jgi:hypothetical protein
VALTLAGCRARAPAAQPPPVTPSLRIADEDFGRDPRTVSGPDAALDLDVVERAFREAYPGVDGAPPGPDPRAIAETRARLASQPRWSPEELVLELAGLFRMPDGHLAFGWDGRSPLRIPAWPRPDVPARANDELSPVELVPGVVPRLVVRTFDSTAAPALEELPALTRRLRELPAFVIDLRGNGGGNFGYAERFLLELTDAPLRALDQREVWSAAAAEGRANSARRRLALGEVPASAAPIYRAHIAELDAAAATLRAAGAAREEHVVRGSTTRGRARGPLRGSVVVLVDGGCASACEMAVALARQIPGVLVAGETTRGSMAVGEVALFQLPRSRLLVSLGTRAFHDPLGGFVETRGYLPDVQILGGDPVARAVALAADAAFARVESGAPTRVSSRR